MIPGAEKAPDATIAKAAQIALTHRLDPFAGDISIYPVNGGEDGKLWIVNIGISAWRREAQRQAKYVINFTPIAKDRMIELRAKLYHPLDRGYTTTLYRLDLAKECKDLGIPYTPTIADGVYRVKALKSSKPESIDGWLPDTIPNTESADSVAQRRAEKKALKIAFSLGFPDAEEEFELEMQRIASSQQPQPPTGDPLVPLAYLQQLFEQRTAAQQSTALPVQPKPKVKVESDGDILFAQ